MFKKINHIGIAVKDAEQAAKLWTEAFGVKARPTVMQEDMKKTPPYLEAKARPLRDKGFDVECVVLEGTPAQSIVDYARDNEVGLIAVATHGHTGFREILMGSTAEYLVKHSGLPILMVTPVKKTKSGK